MISRVWLLTVSVLVCWPHPASADVAWTALLTSVKGECLVNGHPAHTLTKVQAKDTLATSAQGEVVVAFLNGGRRVHLGNSVTVTVLRDNVTPMSPKVTVLESREYSAALMPDGSNLDRLGGTAQTQAHPAPGYVARSLALEPPPVAPPVLGFIAGAEIPLQGRDRVKVSDRKGHSTLLRVRGQSSVVLHDLQPGQPYRVDASNVLGQGETYTVVLWTAADKARLDQAARDAVAAYQSSPGDLTPFAFMCSVYESYGCYDEALKALETVSAQGADVSQLKAAVQEDLSQVRLVAGEAHRHPLK